MSKDQLLNTKGTNSESFSLGLGENKVEIRSIDGVLYFRNYQGAWERVATPVQAASAFILPWATGLAILENQAITYNGSIYIAETDFTAGSTFEDDILNFSKLTTYDHLSSYDTTVDSSPVSVNNTDANIFIFEGTGGTDPFEIRLPPIAQANFGATRIVINNSDSQISVKTSAGADLTPPLLLDIGESANLFITSSGDWLPFGSGGGSADTDLEVIQANSFSVGDVIAKDSGGNYVLATTSDNKLGLVSFADGSRFKVRLIGELDLTGHPSLPLTDGTLYYLSDTTAGEFTDTPPTESFPVFVAISTTSALILPYPQETLGGGGGGGEISRELLDLNDSFYKYNTQTKFLTDTDTLVDNGNTTATVSTSTVFNTAEKLTTENLISDLFLDEPVELSRVESVVRWAYGANLQDHVSRLRASRDGGNTWSNGYLQRQGLQLRAEATVLTQVTQTSEYAVNITTQQKIGQSFQLSKNTVVTKVALSLRKTGLVYGRYRYVIATDSTGPATVITYTDWQLISDLDATLIEKPLELLFPVFLNSATTYHAYIETESLNEYNYSAATRELVVGYANTNPYSGGSVFLFTGTWSASAGNDLAFTIYGKETANIGKSDNSIGNVTFTKNKSQRLISYPTASEDASIEINATTQQNLAESFLINKNFTIDLIRFRMLRTGSPGGQVYVEIYDDNGSGSPGAFRTSSLNRVNISSIGVSAQYVDFKFNDSALTAGNKYHAIIKVSAAYAYVAATNLLSVRSDNSSPLYLQGSLNTYNGSAWALDATKNLSFEVYGEIFDIPNSYDSSYELTTTLDIDDGTSRQKIAQSITPDNQYYLSSIDLLLKRTGSPGGTCYVEIFSDNGGVPNTLLYTSNSVTISNIGTTASFINFSFNDRFFLSSSTPYWISLTTSGYSYTNGVTEIEWINDTNIMNHVGGAALYNGSWGSNASVFVYRVNGIDADLKLEITAIKDSVEMTDLGVKFGFSNEFVSYDPLVNEVSLTSSMLTTGIVPHGLSVSNSKGSLSAILLGHEILSGIDFQTSDGYAIFDTDDLSGITSILFKKNESSVSFGSPELNSRELLRSLPLPTLTQIDEETIQLNSIGGVSTFRFDTPNGVSFGLDGTRISFNSSKNVNNTLTLDTGSEALSESYYLYAVRNGIGDKGELVISANPDGPTGYKYFYLVGTFFNDAAGNITNLKTNQNVTKVITTAISDWTPFTMTIGGTTTAPTKATTNTETAQWRRVGDSMEILYTYRHTSATGAAAGSGTYLFPIPAGYTIDTSKVQSSSGDFNNEQGCVGINNTRSTTHNGAGQVNVYNSTNLYLTIVTATSRQYIGSSSTPLTDTTIVYSFSARVPIVGWSNTSVFSADSTDRLKIEYAHNTDTTNADTIASGFSNTSVGSLVPVVASSAKRKRVRFTKDILPTDKIIVQVQEDGTGPWLDVDGSAFGYRHTDTSLFGMYYRSVNSTDVDVYFNFTRADSVNATSWTTENSNGTRWRVVKYDSELPFFTRTEDIAAIGDWTPYTLTIGATTTAPTTGTIARNNAFWRRVGDSMQIRYEFAQTTAGTAGLGTYLFPIPPGYVIDASKVDVPGSAIIRNNVGSASFDADAGTVGVIEGGVSVYDSTRLFIHGAHDTTQVIHGTGAGTGYNNTNVVVSFEASVPIVGWSSNITVIENANVEYLYNTTTTNATDTTSFGYGAVGSLVPVVASSAKAKRVRASRNLASASVFLQVRDSNTGAWVNAGDSRYAAQIYSNVSEQYGMVLEFVSGSSTDIDISFYKNGTLIGGGVTGRSWTTENSNGTRYRVKVVYNNALVEAPDVEVPDTIGGSGSGQGAKSYVLNGFFETDVDTDTEESDAAVSITEDTSTPLAGTRSANLAWASHAIGDYVGFDLSDIDEVDQGTRFRLRFYKRDGGTFVQGDLEVVYAYTVGTVETEVNFTFGEFGDELPEGDGYIVAYAEISGSASTLGQIRFKALDNAHDFDIDIDELTFGPISQNSVNAIQDWKPFTMTISATSTAPTKATTTIHDKAQWCRIGDSMAITYTYNHTDNTGATAGSGIYLYKLPDGYLIDGSKISFDGAGTSNRTIGGVGAAMIGLQASSSGWAGTVVAYDSTSLAITYHEPVGNDSAFQSHAVSPLTYSSISITFRAVVPIVGWSSNLVTAEDAAVEYLYNTTTTDADDTIAFGYGAAGGLVPSVSGGMRQKRVRAKRSLAGATIALQFKPANTGPWIDAISYTGLKDAYGNDRGVFLDVVSTTDIDICFAAGGRVDFITGTIAWSTEASAGTRWRVKVVYNPAAVEVPDVEITKWQPYTPTTQGFGAVAGVEFSWRRVGQCYEVKGRFTTGTVSGDEAQIGLPNGATVGTQISASGVFRVGSIARNNHAGPNAVIATPGDAFVNLAYEGSSPWGLTPRAGNSVLQSIELVSFDFSVPIAGL